jgi:MutL C terminal dimerisation domain
VSFVTGDFKERLSTYALDSPGGGRGLDSSLTPVPEVSIPQSSPTPRKSEPEDEEDAEENEEEKEEPVLIMRQSRPKRSLISVISSTQLDLLGVPTKKTKIETRKPLVQTNLRETFLRKAREGEGRRTLVVEDLELLTPEQVENALAEVDAREEEEEVGEDGEDEGEEMEEIETEDVEMEDVSVESDEDDRADEEEDEEVDEEAEEAAIEKTKPSPSKPDAGSRTLFRPRLKNAVHNLRTQTHLTLSSLRAQHTALTAHLPSHPSHPGNLEPAKEYAEPMDKAEERLSLTVAKEDFARMRIVGQFNLGFIIAVREKEGQEGEDVFIIDQHASDEKFNFERLQAETVMQVQALARYPLKSISHTNFKASEIGPHGDRRIDCFGSLGRLQTEWLRFTSFPRQRRTSARDPHVGQHRLHPLRPRGVDPPGAITPRPQERAVFQGTGDVCYAGVSVEYYDWEGAESADDGAGCTEFGGVG